MKTSSGKSQTSKKKNKRPVSGGADTVIPRFRDTLCNGFVIRPLPDNGGGAGFLVTLLRTGEARVVKMPDWGDNRAKETLQKHLITVMNALEWSVPVSHG